jgi:uncharacterized protein YkwD
MTCQRTLRARPCLEKLEDRCLLSAVVTLDPNGVLQVTDAPPAAAQAGAPITGAPTSSVSRGGARNNRFIMSGGLGHRLSGRRARRRHAHAPTSTDALVSGPRRVSTSAAVEALPAGENPDAGASVFQQTNQARLAQGLSALTVNPQLQQMAQQQADALAALDRLGDSGGDGHVVNGQDFPTRLAASGYQFNTAGENVGWYRGVGDPATQVFTNWMGSPGHQENILNPAFTEIGTAVTVSATGKVFGVQEFGRPATMPV